MDHKFNEYKQLELSQVNKEILKQWEEKEIFARSLKEREGAPSFIFFEGPPSANGMPGIHHVIARSIKDIFCRYKTMKGFLVNRKAGWDTHGLPVELGVEKSLGITKESIGRSISVADYNAACRKDVMKYTKEWVNLTNQMGYWVDMEHPYITYDNRYIETLWYLLKQIYNKGLLYKGYTIQPYSPAAGTGLSSHELNQPGCYRDVKDTTCIAQFKIIDPKPEITRHGEAFFLAWTTTPWTLPSNTALAVGPNIEYCIIETFNPYTSVPITIIMAKPLMHTLFDAKFEGDEAMDNFKNGDKHIPYRVIDTVKGADLVGMRYEQLIPWVNPGEGAFRVIPGDFVTTEDGTGIVHIAPTFGADDDRVAKQNGVPPLMMIDKDGMKRPMVDLRGRFFKVKDLDPKFVEECVDLPLYDIYAGKYVKNAYDKNKTDKDDTLDIEISVMLKMQGKVFRIEKHTHNYPHCWRTDKPVLYYPLDSWFIRTTAVKDRMIELNKTIKWKPESTGTGRFGKWLENLQDWNLSRSRFWGTPLPIWRSEDGKEEICIGSVEELLSEIDKAVEAGLMEKNPYKDFVVGDNSAENYDKIDLHRPYVDNIVLLSPSGQPMHREADLIDVWFDSGAMPFAQQHYPFEHKEDIENGKLMPADFIAEGVDQTRGWFFTLHAIATMIGNTVAFKNVVSNGLVLDKNGNKMSKRLGNAVDPFSTIEQYGSDPLRWYMITNSSPWDNLKFDVDGIDEVKRKFFGTLHNTYQFFALYANLDHFTATEPLVEIAERAEIDRWILSSLNTLIEEVDTQLEDYEPTKAARAISDFVIEQLSNWYVRLSRRRFWAGEMTKDKLAAYQTLYQCLLTISKLMAPVSPFYADRLYCDLVNGLDGAKDSVHLERFPKVDQSCFDKKLERSMSIAQQITSMVLSLRRKVNIKVRQPLMTLMIPLNDIQKKRTIEHIEELIKAEVNVKEIKYVDDNSGVLVKRIKPDFKKLGPKYGKIMKLLAEAIKNMSQDEIRLLEKEGSFDIEYKSGEPKVSVLLEDVEIASEDIPGWLVANEDTLTVALDVTVTEELRKEGLAREFVNRIQNLRKQSGFELNDKINLLVLSSDEMDEVIKEYHDYISKEVQAEKLELHDAVSDSSVLEFDDFTINVQIEKL